MKIDEVITESAAELQRAAERHRMLLEAAASEGRMEIPTEACMNVTCPYRCLLRKTVLDTVRTLDDTRKTFKSRQLAELRQRLMTILAEQG